MTSEKAIIFVRVSGKGQQEDDQIPDCRRFCSEHDWEVIKVFKEQVSAWKKNVERKVLDKCLRFARTHKIKNIVCWDLDRLYRNRAKSVETIKGYGKLGIRLHFVRQAFLETILEVPSPFDEIVYDQLTQLLSWLAEEESNKRSDRVKKAYKYGNHENWGRNPVPYADEQIYQAYQKYGSLRKASEHLPYRCKNRKKKFVSRTKISEIVRKFKNCPEKHF